jgi:aryl-alcohol dehydrogenase-like predicted oxidoreductase
MSIILVMKMKYFQLKNTEIKPSVLGFGCAPILGRVGKKESLKALGLAYDLGINYFDVARSYGFGEAEKLLGQFLHDKRDSVYIATKFGIAPSNQTRLLKYLKPIVRNVLSVVPQARKVMKKQSSNLTERGDFSVNSAKTSLETSLKELGTEYVDILFLHGCTPDDCKNEILFEFLDSCTREGKVRYIGISTGIDETLEILNSSNVIQVVQVKNNIFEQNLSQLQQYDNLAINTHSPLGGADHINKLRTLVSQKPEILANWSQMLDIQDLDFSKLTKIVFQYAVEAVSDKGVVINSMFKEQHIIENTNLVNSPVYSQEQVLKLALLLENMKTKL